MKIDKCPFCGSNDVHTVGQVVDWNKEAGPEMFMRVSCKNCGANGPETKCRYKDLDECEENAIKAWNKRK